MRTVLESEQEWIRFDGEYGTHEEDQTDKRELYVYICMFKRLCKRLGPIYLYVFVCLKDSASAYDQRTCIYNYLYV